LWIALKSSKLEHLLKKAKDLEKKYEWLQAAELYQKALLLSFISNKLGKKAELQEQIGFCFYRAAFQAQSNIEFNERLRLVIQAYNKAIKVLEGWKEENNQAKIKHAQALIVYAQSWLETSGLKRKELLEEWWTLENEVLEAYESIGDVRSIGNVSIEMSELSLYTTWLTDFSELERFEKQTLSLIDKGIQSLSKSGNNYELAVAYTIASFRLSFDFISLDSFDKGLSKIQRCQDYLKKALELSKKIGDARLIGFCYISAMNTEFVFRRNRKLALEYSEKIHKYGIITKDNFLLGYSAGIAATIIVNSSVFLEDPDKQRENLKKARKLAQECRRLSQIINHVAGFFNGLSDEIQILTALAAIETDPKTKQHLLKIATRINQEGFQYFKEWKRLSGFLYRYFGASLSLLAETKSDIKEKKSLLLEAQSYQKKYIAYVEELYPYYFGSHSRAYYDLGKVQQELAQIESGKIGKIALLKNARACLEKSNNLIDKSRLHLHREDTFTRGVLWKHNDRLGKILQQIYSLTKEEKTLSVAIDAYKTAASSAEEAELTTHVAESQWHIAFLLSQRGKHQEAFQSYELASEAYDIVAKKIPQLKEFYGNYSIYMNAWSQIEQARSAHSIEEYAKAAEFYSNAAGLLESSKSWNYIALNYFAWASVEEAEDLSRKENTQQAKQTFQKAMEQFTLAEDSFKQKLEEITSADEKEMPQRLFEASDLRRKYCQARILIEEAKLLDREGKYFQSSKSYQKAATNISAIVEKLDVEAERKELEYVAILCRAWEKMATAEETTSSESYLEAAELFEQAKEHCFTRKASLWALGNSNFCKGLAAGVQYQTSLELKKHAKAKSFMKNASTNYAKAGFKAASEYAKATQRLFDAYAFMNQAENELDQEKRAKQYQLAENLLQLAAGSFMRAKQPEKTSQVQEILANVREEKTLAISLSQVMKAPTIVSTTQAFTAPTTTSEVSVGLKTFEHANVQANLVTQVKEIKVGESFCLSVEFVNAGREPALLTRVEDVIPSGFVVVKKPEIFRIEENSLNMKGKQLAPLKLVEIKLTLQPSKKGNYQLNPKVHYLDELGQNKSLQLKTLEFKVEEVVLGDRVPTGTKELDSLLLGGIPKEYAVALTCPPSDEREHLIRNFLEAGIKKDETVFYVSTEAYKLETLIKKSNFCLFLCNPKPKTKVPDLPNIYKLRSKTDLTNLSISLAKAYRNIDQSKKKRICVEIVSDVLLDYEAKATRKWISELITDLCSKGFTMLAVIDPEMHPSEQSKAIINLFDGEISLKQTEDPLECKKSVQIKKLRNEEYIKNPICLK